MTQYIEPSWGQLLQDADERKDDPLVRMLANQIRYLLGCRQELRRTNGELAGLKIDANWPRPPIGHWTDEELERLKARNAEPADFNRIGRAAGFLGDPPSRSLEEITEMQDAERALLADKVAEYGKLALDDDEWGEHAKANIPREMHFDKHVQMAEDKRMIDAGYRYDEYRHEWVKR